MKIYAPTFLKAVKFAINEGMQDWSYANVSEIPFATNITYRVKDGVILCFEGNHEKSLPRPVPIQL